MFTTQNLIDAINKESKSVADYIEKGGNPGDDAFWDIRDKHHEYLDQIKAYQMQNQISGLITNKLTIGHKSIKYHETHHELLTLDSDLIVLQKEKNTIINFFLSIISDNYSILNNPQLANSDESEYLDISQSMIKLISQNADFAYIYYSFCWCPISGGVCQKINFPNSKYCPDLRLTIGWGKPESTIFTDGTGTSKTFVKGAI
jgi:hypothetical protein